MLATILASVVLSFLTMNAAVVAMTYRNHRIITGEGVLESDRGIVGRVSDVEEEQDHIKNLLIRVGLLEPKRADGGET